MPGLVVNTQAALEARKPLDPGEYHVVLTNHKVVTKVAPDKYPYISLEMTVADDEGEYAGRKVFRILSSSPDSLWAMVDAAVAFGADVDEINEPAVDMDAVFNQLRGGEAWVITSINSYQRNENDPVQERTQVDRIMSEASTS